MKNSLEVDYTELNLRITELKELQDCCGIVRESLGELEGAGQARDSVNELVNAGNEVIGILDEYFINETIETLKKIKEGYEESEENSILKMQLLLGEKGRGEKKGWTRGIFQ